LQRRDFLLGAAAVALARRADAALDDRVGDATRIGLSPVFLGNQRVRNAS